MAEAFVHYFSIEHKPEMTEEELTGPIRAALLSCDYPACDVKLAARLEDPAPSTRPKRRFWRWRAGGRDAVEVVRSVTSVYSVTSPAPLSVSFRQYLPRGYAECPHLRDRIIIGFNENEGFQFS